MLKYVGMDTGNNLLKLNIRLSCNVLKTLACIFMFIDHIGYGVVHNYLIKHAMDIDPARYTTLNNVYEVCKGIGRLAFPIFCFFIVEGFIRTHDVKKYLLRLGIFAAISEVPFDLGLFGSLWKDDHQNILITFFIAILMLLCIRYIEQNVLGLSVAVVWFVKICAIIAFSDLAFVLHTDYSWKCMLLAAVLYFMRSAGPVSLICGAAATSWEKYAPISFVLLYFYDPSIRPRFKYAFYAFYPLNFVIVWLIAKLVI